MERPAFRVWATLKGPARRWVFAVSAALLGCSSAVLLYSSKSPPAPSTRPAPLAAKASSAPELLPPKTFALDEFSPFLTRPQLRPVADALDADDSRGAAAALLAARASDTTLATPSVALWLGRLWERALDSTQARDACGEARAGALLRDYATLCWARAELALGKSQEALAELSAGSFESPAEAERLLLVARAARAQGQRSPSLAAFRKAVSSADGVERARAALELAGLLLDTLPPAGLAQPSSVDALEALTELRAARVVLAASKADRARIAELERRAQALLSPEERARSQQPSLEERVASIAALVDARDHETAERDAAELLGELPEAERFSPPACDARLLRARALAGLRKWSAALEALEPARDGCAADAERGARIFFLSGRYAASDGKPTLAIHFFEDVERRFPTHSLADDARFNAALAEEDRGVGSRFAELLLSLSEFYPKGDMVPEGLFRLALRDLERGDWSSALGPLERALGVLGDGDRARGFELAGRERFFHARALIALGKREAGLDELELLVKENPLSYYMLAAYSFLEREVPGRAEAAIALAATQAEAEPFRIARGREFDSPGFARMLELLRIGEVDAAVRELDALGLRRAGLGSEILWGIALLYERAGFPKFSSEITRLRLGEVSGRWPVGQWAKAWEIAFPRPYLDVVTREASAAAVDPALVYAVMREESVFDPSAVSAASAYGLMQLIVPTAKHAARGTHLPYSPAALKRPRVNVALGCRELSRLAGLFEENPLLVVPAYNAGPARARAWLKERPGLDFDVWVERIPFLETRRYTKRVLSSRAVYAFLYEQKAASSRLTLPRKVAN